MLLREGMSTIHIGGDGFRWTEHAYERAFERYTHPYLMNDVLGQALETMLEIPKNDFVFRDFISRGSFTLARDRYGRNIFWVITFGWVREMYPRAGDTVIQRAKDGQFSTFEWIDKGKILETA